MDIRERHQGSIDAGKSLSENMGLPTNTMGGTMSVTKGNLGTIPNKQDETLIKETNWGEANYE